VRSGRRLYSARKFVAEYVEGAEQEAMARTRGEIGRREGIRNEKRVRIGICRGGRGRGGEAKGGRVGRWMNDTLRFGGEGISPNEDKSKEKSDQERSRPRGRRGIINK
jgi:hypothetical protein